MTRILLVVPSLGRGGMEHVVIALGRVLRAQGVAVRLAVLQPAGALRPLAEAAGLEVQGPSSPTTLGQDVAFLRHTAHAFDATVLHSHTGAWLPAALASRRLHGVRHIHTRHGFVEGARAVDRLSEWLAARGTETVACVSGELLEATRRQLRVPARRSLCIPNGVDADAILAARGQAPFLPQVIPLAMVCRVTAVKNIPLALDALHRALPVVPTLQLHVVGDGPELARCQAQARALGVADRVVWHGAQPEPWAVVPTRSIYLQSSDSEGLSLSLLEALIAGCEVVATDVGHTRTFCQPLPGVQLIPPRDAEALAAGIVTIARQAPATAQQLGAMNASYGVTHGSLTRMVSAYRALYGAETASA